ncbi:MAG: TlyA family RNA methyltransferase [Synergistaceae bacterium]|nr:TlyA family RNA methyltransferase [Synergistaceae bacterium]
MSWKTGKNVSRERLDKVLVALKLAESRARAQAMILAGLVCVDGQRADKAGTPVGPSCEIKIDEGKRWASRGAFKLLKALETFKISVEGRICVDIGASTGGFTDVLLNAGAKKVYAVDVGYGQLLSRLAKDPKVAVIDRTNARTLTPDHFNDAIDLVVCDASFISLRLLLPPIDAILAERGEAMVLIKPQFEAGRQRLGRGGVVRDPLVHEAVLREVLNFALQETRLRPAGLSWSPILGPEGNVEFLCRLNRNATAPIDAAAVVEAAHRELEGGKHPKL